MLATLPNLSARPALRVAVRFSAPWAFTDDLSLDGVEVREARRYAQWRGRGLVWTKLGAESLPQAFAEGRVDLAIGGLLATRRWGLPPDWPGSRINGWARRSARDHRDSGMSGP